MILCVGEILADLTERRDGGTSVYECRAGGAPFNVACGVQKLGGESAFVGCVGDDAMGEFLTRFAESRNLCDLEIRKDFTRNTTLAFVRVDDNGERSFSFYRKNTADAFLPPIDEARLRRAAIVHVGSLLLGTDDGRAYARRLAEAAHAAGKRVSFDVNYRADLFASDAHAKIAYADMLQNADIVKLSEEELALFGDAVAGSPQKTVFVTMGAQGSEWRKGGKKNFIPSLRVHPVDTTGAGDAFYAGVLSQLDKAAQKDADARLLNAACLFGNVCGALNTLRRGAIDALPTLETVQETLRQLQ